MKAKAAITKIDFSWRIWAALLILNVVFLASWYFIDFNLFITFGSSELHDFLVAYWWVIGGGILVLLSVAAYPLILLDSRRPFAVKLAWSAANLVFHIPAALIYWLTMIESPRFRLAKSSNTQT